tara:strand:+ start:162 stop:536 length:375 start_codon:yes stop_codon:yes gene_type:complete
LVATGNAHRRKTGCGLLQKRSGFPKQDTLFIILIGGKHVAFCLIYDMASEVTANNNVPTWVILFVEHLFDLVGNGVLTVEVFEAVEDMLLDSGLHIGVHVNNHNAQRSLIWWHLLFLIYIIYKI